jgi:hypothetical protein
MLFLRLCLLFCTAWALQGTNRYSEEVGRFYDHNGFVDRISIAEDIRHRVEKKVVYQHVDIVPFIMDVLRWRLNKRDILKNEEMLILNFG